MQRVIASLTMALRMTMSLMSGLFETDDWLNDGLLIDDLQGQEDLQHWLLRYGLFLWENQMTSRIVSI